MTGLKATCLRCEEKIHQDDQGTWRTEVGDEACPRNPARDGHEPRLCGAQTYWYENGVQRAKWCPEPATMRTRGGGVTTPCCDEHGAMTIEAGATRVETEDRVRAVSDE